MKKFIPVLIASLLLSYTLRAQSSGDYRSVSSGIWNDPTKWEIFNGSNWIGASTYPGQNSGTGAVDISAYHEIRLTASVPHPIASLSIQSFYDEYWTYESYYGVLIFSAEFAVSLNVSGTVNNSGILNVDDQPGSKSHLLFVGGSLYGSMNNGINGDDKLSVVFNSTIPNTFIDGGTFQDVTFNGNVFTVATSIIIHGSVTFINGIVSALTEYSGNAQSGTVTFKKGATWSGASTVSYVDGWVGKEGDEAFTFPVGDNGIYAPLTISAAAGQTDLWFGKYKRETGSALGGITDPGLFNVSQCEYWNLTPGNFPVSYPLSITVGWDGSRGCGTSPYITNVANVTLAHFGASASSWMSTWNSHGGTATGAIENGSITQTVTNVFGPFTFGNIGACKTPSGLTTSNITGSSATLSWSGEPNAVTYDVYYLGGYGPTVGWQNAVLATTSTSVNLSGLNQATNYLYRVRANCSSGTSSDRQSEFTTLTVCEQPASLITTNVTNVSATFTWAQVPGATSYHIEYEHYSTWIPVDEVITTTSFTLGGLSSGSYYRWKVRANCPLGSSHYQYSDHFYTYYASCAGPTGLTTTNITNNSATLNWVAIPNASNYYVDYKQSTSTTWITLSTGGTSLLYTLNGLSASTEYNWRVLANCSGNYAYASFTTGKTPPPPPPPPCNDIYEINNTPRQAKTFGLGTTISAMISSNTDIDWFKITAPNNSNYTLQVALANLPADYDLYLYDKNQTLIGSSTNNGTSNEVVMYNSNTRKATYYIKVIGKNGAFNTSQCYNLLAQVSNGPNSASSKSYPANEVTEISEKELLYPNPASEFVYLNFNSATEGLVNIQIVNSIGQLVKQHPVHTIKGHNQFKIQVADIRAGMYVLRINKGDLNITRKFVIAR